MLPPPVEGQLNRKLRMATLIGRSVAAAVVLQPVAGRARLSSSPSSRSTTSSSACTRSRFNRAIRQPLIEFQRLLPALAGLIVSPFERRQHGKVVLDQRPQSDRRPPNA